MTKQNNLPISNVVMVSIMVLSSALMIGLFVYDLYYSQVRWTSLLCLVIGVNSFGLSAVGGFYFVNQDK